MRIDAHCAAGAEYDGLCLDHEELASGYLDAGRADYTSVVGKQVGDHHVLEELDVVPLLQLFREHARELRAWNPYAPGVGVTGRMRQLVNAGAPINQFLQPHGRLVAVNRDQALVVEVLSLFAHVFREFLGAVIHVPGQSEQLCGAAAVDVDVCVGGERGSALAHDSLGGYYYRLAPLARLQRCPGSGAFAADYQYVSYYDLISGLFECTHAPPLHPKELNGVDLPRSS